MMLKRITNYNTDWNDSPSRGTSVPDTDRTGDHMGVTDNTSLRLRSDF